VHGWSVERTIAGDRAFAQSRLLRIEQVNQTLGSMSSPSVTSNSLTATAPW
jgi:hypothetical protein